jgi:hypothetical protein
VAGGDFYCVNTPQNNIEKETRNMADQSREVNASSIGYTTMKIGIDISEALTGLKALQREVRKATQALRELETENQINTGSDYDKYKREIERLIDVNIEGFKVTNDTIYSAYHNEEKEIDLYFGRCVGVSTSIKALMNVYDNVAYIKPHRPIPNVHNKVVFVEAGLDLPRGSRPKKIIRIRQIDSYGIIK